MATRGNTSIRGLAISCSLCLEQIKQPKVLSCGHTFCLNPCLKKLYISGNLVCPLCTEPIILPTSGKIKDLPTNYALLDAIEQMNLLSQRASSSAMHYISGPRRTRLCEEHGEQRQFYCQDCDAEACLLCVCALKDMGHRVINLNKAIELRAVTLNQYLQELDDLLSQSVQVTKDMDLKGRMKDLKGRQEIMCYGIFETAEMFRAQIAEKEQSFVRNLNENCDKCLAQLMELESEYQSWQKKIIRTRGMVQRRLELNQSQSVSSPQSDAIFENKVKLLQKEMTELQRIKTENFPMFNRGSLHFGDISAPDKDMGPCVGCTILTADDADIQVILYFDEVKSSQKVVLKCFSVTKKIFVWQIFIPCIPSVEQSCSRLPCYRLVTFQRTVQHEFKGKLKLAPDKFLKGRSKHVAFVYGHDIFIVNVDQDKDKNMFIQFRIPGTYTSHTSILEVDLKKDQFIFGGKESIYQKKDVVNIFGCGRESGMYHLMQENVEVKHTFYPGSAVFIENKNLFMQFVVCSSSERTCVERINVKIKDVAQKNFLHQVSAQNATKKIWETSTIVSYDKPDFNQICVKFVALYKNRVVVVVWRENQLGKLIQYEDKGEIFVSKLRANYILHITWYDIESSEIKGSIPVEDEARDPIGMSLLDHYLVMCFADGDVRAFTLDKLE